MPVISSSTASLRIFGDTLVAQEITARLGTKPTASYRKGDIKRLRSGTEVVRKTGMWLLQVEDKKPADLNLQIVELFSRLPPDLEVWRTLSGQYDVDLFCGLFMEGSSEWLCLSPSTLALVAERGIEMQLDVYGPVQEVSPTDSCPCGSGKSYVECCAPK